jgi:hypothetical protein
MQWLICGFAMMLVSCATPGFERAWKKSVAAGPSVKSDVTGAWAGEWSSAANGHTGKLRCLVERKDEDSLSFWYWASWHGWLTGTFRVEGDAQSLDGGTYEIKGSKKLGPWGTYSHEGVIGSSRFDAGFRSERSNLGAFHLVRPRAPR